MVFWDHAQNQNPIKTVYACPWPCRCSLFYGTVQRNDLICVTPDTKLLTELVLSHLLEFRIFNQQASAEP